MSTIVLFGSFDPLHAGHRHLFQQAKTVADTVIVVVARDQTIKEQKNYQPMAAEAERLNAVQVEPIVSKALLGDDTPGNYGLLRQLEFDFLGLGYDQLPDDATVGQILQQCGKSEVVIVRFKPYQPETYKSSKLRHV